VTSTAQLLCVDVDEALTRPIVLLSRFQAPEVVIHGPITPIGLDKAAALGATAVRKGRPNMPAAEASARPGRDHPIWSGAFEALSNAGHPMTAREVANVLRARGWQLHAEYADETVRVAMNRRDDLFEKIPASRFYALVEWPPTRKRVPTARAREGGE
jgi:hypothetical protein